MIWSDLYFNKPHVVVVSDFFLSAGPLSIITLTEGVALLHHFWSLVAKCLEWDSAGWITPNRFIQQRLVGGAPQLPRKLFKGTTQCLCRIASWMHQICPTIIKMCEVSGKEEKQKKMFTHPARLPRIPFSISA